jgi:hypothetical protein
MARLAFVLWFFNYCLFSVFSYALGAGRHGILDYIIYSAVWVVVELVCLGIIEDMA